MYEIYPNPKIADKTVAEERHELEEFKIQGMVVDQTTGLSNDISKGALK